MPITEITYQPTANSINAAFASIAYRCKAKIPNASIAKYICPVVFADIYVEGIYYKTLSRTQFINDDGIAPEYEFDIQDAIQELMGYNLPRMEGTTIEQFNKTIKKVFVKFRNSFLDSEGFSISEQFAPVQGTSSTKPISGAGIPTESIYVLNSVIQHEENQKLDELLESYKTGIWENALPLTKRPEVFKICRTDSSHFPIVSESVPREICVKAKLKTGEIIDLCEEILVDCPDVSNITYSVVDNGDGTQTFTFNWDLPSMAGITGLNIFYSIEPSNGWEFNPGTVNSPRSITTYLGKYYFRFQLVGSCKSNSDTLSLPGFNNIGLTDGSQNNPPTVVIKWNDNNGIEVRTCTLPVCNFTVKVEVNDPDNDIVSVQILKSINNGVTWNSFISHLLSDNFSDLINTTGSQLYKAIVIDSNNNQAESNVLSYSKQKQLNSIYKQYITGITCNGQGDSATNYDVYCTGSVDFALSDINLLNLSTGFIRLKIDGGTGEIGISKSGGGSLIIDEIIAVNTLITASYAAVGQNPPSAYPWGYPANAPAAIYTFEYSLDGISGWAPFDLLIDD